MQKYFRIVFCLLICALINFSCNHVPQDARQALLKDLNFYRDSITAHAYAPFQHISEADFIQGIEDIKHAAVHKNEDELIMDLRILDARRLDNNSMIGEFKETKVLPLRCYWLDEGMYILQTDADNVACVNSKLIAVGNYPIQTVIEKIAATTSVKSGSGIKDYVLNDVSSMSVLHGLDITDNTDSVTITLVNEQNDTLKQVVHSKKKKEFTFLHNVGFSLLRFSRREDYWYHYDNIKNYLYFKYSHAPKDSARTYDQFLSDLFATVKAKRPDNMIIDLRDNWSRVRTNITPFVSQLKEAVDAGMIKKVFVLTGRRTFTAGLYNIADISASVKLTTVGEPTGGTINHFGRAKSFKLPNTGLKVAYSTTYVVNDRFKDSSLIPDVVIKETFADYSNRTDAALEYAIDH